MKGMLINIGDLKRAHLIHGSPNVILPCIVLDAVYIPESKEWVGESLKSLSSSSFEQRILIQKRLINAFFKTNYIIVMLTQSTI